MDGSLARPAPRRRGLAAVYAVAAATALVPCVLIVSQLRTVRAEHLPMLAVGLS